MMQHFKNGGKTMGNGKEDTSVHERWNYHYRDVWTLGPLFYNYISVLLKSWFLGRICENQSFSNAT